MGCAIGCGRSTVYECVVGVSPTSLDFGSTAFGTTVSRSVTVSSLYNNSCFLSGIAIGPGSDPGFAVQDPGNLGIEPETELPITVTFTPVLAAPHARATLVFQTSDASQPAFSIPLSATVQACDLSPEDGGANFGMVALGNLVTRPLELTNLGLETCDVSFTLSATSEPGFSLPSFEPTSLSIPPGQSSTLSIQFEADANVPPSVRRGDLTISSNDPQSPSQLAPLQAELPACALGIIPPVLDFGNIALDAVVTDHLILVNDGGEACAVSGIALAATSDPDFSLPPQATAFSLAPGEQIQVLVTFDDLSGATPPLLRQGTLGFETGDPLNPTAEVPLEAYVNVACDPTSQSIYTVDGVGRFASFDPGTLTFTELGTLSCPTRLDGSPFSMAIDQNAVAWVVYTSGELFRVDTSTVACQSTTFAVNQSGLLNFGMSFVFQPATGLDTLYVAGWLSFGGTSDDLATISFPSLVLTPIAPVLLGQGELAGTGDGELWDFVPGENLEGGAVLAQLDPDTAEVIATLPLPNINAAFSSYATKFWGGSFWIFVDNLVYQVPRATGVATLVIGDDGYEIVGAGVSTCAPVQ